jgi:hypothetical protein
LHYLAVFGDVAVRQMEAREANIRLSARQRQKKYTNPIPKEIEQRFRAVRKAAEDLEAKRQALPDRRAAQAHAWGYVPDRATLARLLDRKGDYRFFYDLGSWIAHPGIFGYDEAIQRDGRWVRLTTAFSPRGVYHVAGTTAVTSFCRLVHRTNEIIGPVSRLEDFHAFVEARKVRLAPDP